MDTLFISNKLQAFAPQDMAALLPVLQALLQSKVP
jgi:hypothetical protein